MSPEYCTDTRYGGIVTSPSPCSWPIDRSCLPSVDGDVDIAKQSHAEALAVQVLWSLSGRQFGVCPVMVRPCPQRCAGISNYSYYPPQLVGSSFFPIWENGQWRNISCGCAGACDWNAPSVVHLAASTGLPVQEVTEVRIGATALDDSAYVLEGELLYRADGTAWPSQDLSLPLGNEGTWSVTYTRGNPVPEGVAVFAGLLTKEFVSACSGGRCRLPRRVRSVSRQGVSYDMVDPTDIYISGKTGLPEIDLWLSAVNPQHLAAPPKVR